MNVDRMARAGPWPATFAYEMEQHVLTPEAVEHLILMKPRARGTLAEWAQTTYRLSAPQGGIRGPSPLPPLKD
jgi:hypothetical protein